MKKVDGEAH